MIKKALTPQISIEGVILYCFEFFNNIHTLLYCILNPILKIWWFSPKLSRLLYFRPASSHWLSTWNWFIRNLSLCFIYHTVLFSVIIIILLTVFILLILILRWVLILILLILAYVLLSFTDGLILILLIWWRYLLHICWLLFFDWWWLGVVWVLLIIGIL